MKQRIFPFVILHHVANTGFYGRSSMGISTADRKHLWGRSGGRCAFPECGKKLIREMGEYVDTPDVVQNVTLGEEAHIVAESDSGPRSDPEMSQKHRDSYANLILLCEEHHKVIDAAGGRYFSVDVLREMKREHEAAVDRNMERSLGGGEEAAERTSRFISEWSRRVDLDEWDAWTSSLLAPSPVIDRARFDRYSETVIWLSNRAWPTSHFSGVQRAVKIFAEVWRDLIGVIDREFAYHRNMRDRFCLREKHKEIDWDEKLYKQYGDEFDFLVDVIHELIYHATAAANLICDRVRDEVDHGYRFDEGRISITRGPNEFLRFEHFRPSYADEHRLSGDPYPGLTGIKKIVVETYGHRL